MEMASREKERERDVSLCSYISWYASEHYQGSLIVCYLSLHHWTILLRVGMRFVGTIGPFVAMAGRHGWDEDMYAA